LLQEPEMSDTEKTATLHMLLNADNGYTSKTEGARVSLAQWGDICAIEHGLMTRREGELTLRVAFLEERIRAAAARLDGWDMPLAHEVRAVLLRTINPRS